MIIEVLGRSKQGVTLPFLCRGDDAQLYYVKGRYAGLHSLCCEWVAGNLALAMNLPLPPFVIAEVPEALITGSDRADIQDLGAGLVFASARVENAQEITWTEAEHCEEEMKALVLVFDWWVHNEDRILSERGGNPNLLISIDDEGRKKLWVFDFNLAFDTTFSDERFRKNHIFSKLLQEWPLGVRERIALRMKTALDRLNEWFESLPKEWQHIGGDETLSVQLEQNMVLETLTRVFSDPAAFWNRL